MVREIKTTLALDGEKQFKASMDDAYRAMKLLGSETKLNTATFGQNANSMEALTAKQKNLGDMQKQQKAIVEALTKAADEAAIAYGENSKKTDEYRTKLNNAKASLAGIENQLGETATQIENFGDKTAENEKRTKAWKDALGKAGDALDKTADITKKALIAVGAFAGAVVKAGSEIFDLAKDTGELADELLTTSAQTGISTKKLQEWTYAAEFIDTEVDTMTKSMAKMIRQMGSAKSGTEKSAAAFSALGISIVDSNGQLRDSETVFFEAIDALGRVGNETERDALAMEIFGKSAQELNPLIIAGSAQLQSLGEEAHRLGVVMSDETVKSFGEFDDKMNVMNGTVQAVKNSFITSMLPAIETISTVVQDIATKFKDWLKSDGAQALIGTLTDKIIALASNLGGNLGPIMESVIGAFDKIIGAIGWAIENIDLLTTTVGVLAAAFVTLKIAKVVTDVMSLATALANPVVAGFVLVAAAIGGMAYALGGAQRELDGTISRITPFEESVAGLTPTLVNVNDLLSASGRSVAQLDAAIKTSEEAITSILATALAENRTLRQDELNSIQSFNAQLLALQLEKLTLYRDQQLAELRKLQLEENTLTQENAAQRIANAQAAYAQSNAITEEAYTAQLAIIENKYRAMNQVGSEAYNTELLNAQTHYNSSLAENKTYVAESYAVATNAAARWVDVDRKKWDDLNEWAKYSGRQYSSAVDQMDLDNAQAFMSMVATTKRQGGVLSADTLSTAAAILAAFDNLPPYMEKAGKNALLGVTQGMENQIPALNSAATMTSDEIVDTVKAELGINSPSTVMMGVGANISKGLAEGLKGDKSWLRQQLSTWSGDVITWIKNVFGIKSPSTVMRDLIGKPMVQGMAIGITGNAGLIDQAMSSLVPSALNSHVDMNITRRFSDVANSSAYGNNNAAEIVAGFRAALAEHNEQVIVLNDREFGRAVRKVAMA